jgi:hypothetical protein
VAVFDSGTLNLVTEHEIWSRNNAWTYPAVGVNARGDVGVLLYAMGGSISFPEAQGFILTDPRNWSTITMNDVANSDSTISPSAPTNGWGDYASVHRYDSCTNTFLGTVWTGVSGSAQLNSVWFGDPDDGCPDLQIVSTSGSPTSIARGSTLDLTQSTQNVGSATAAASRTRYYLSVDRDWSTDDVRLKTKTSIPSLGAGKTNGPLVPGPDATATVPKGIAASKYFVIACADDLGAVAEVSETNNCLTGATKITVT